MPRAARRISPILASLLALSASLSCTPPSNAPADGGNNGGSAAGQTVIEPDDYPDGTELTHAKPSVTLTTAVADNSIVELFHVTAKTDAMGYAPTGTRVFTHSNIPFFNNDRRLRMDFASPAGPIQISFAGGTFGQTEVGHLQAFDAAGSLLAEYVTKPLGPGETELMTVNIGGIAWAVAYSEGDHFGRLDQLIFNLGG